MNYYKKKMLIKHLLIILKELQEKKDPKTAIEDSYYRSLLSILSKEQQELTKRLIHYLTLLNKSFREQERGIYQSTHEDVHLALELIQDVIKPQSILTKKEQTQLEQIEQEYLGDNFSRKEVQELLKLSKSPTHRLLSKLEDLGIIQREDSYKNQGYIYSFVIESIDIQELFSDNEHIEFTDIR